MDEIARNYCKAISSYKGERPALLIHGGEPTVNIKGTGRGGRNQQLVHEMLNLHLREQRLKGTSLFSFYKPVRVTTCNFLITKRLFQIHF